MDWKGRRKSGNMEDRRGISAGKAAAGGGLIAVIVLLLQFFGGETGQQLAPLIEQFAGNQNTEIVTRELTAKEIETGEFVATVLADTEDVWHKIFKENNLGEYIEPKVVLFTEQVNTACGAATSSVGPFYCPADQIVYMDLDFFEELKTRFGAKGGDFAIAYVIGHEIGHHIQTILGTNAEVSNLQRKSDKVKANKLSVGLELQADFYAGVWAHHIKKYIDAQDIDEALSAAHAVGDDAIQKRMQGHVVPDSFTHGTSEQRKRWFTKGFQTGDIKQGNTFDEVLN
ncbi:MAG TPA: neutral zinc metallopeptidase [Brumimicrobium sp.]|nr:neutral zinc metallopeptidase [Brumimicrobium sp.]